MKTTEILTQYADGRRDFRRENLSGKNFRGKDLSGCNFSECDIRGTNFQEANLTQTKFIKAKGGLTLKSTILLLLSAIISVALCGLLSNWSGSLIGQTFDSSTLEYELSSWFTLVSLLTFCVISYRKGLATGAFAFAVAFAFVVALVFVFADADNITVVVAIGGAVAGAVAFFFAVAFAVAFFFAVAFAFAFVLALVFTVAFVFVFNGAAPLSLVGAVALTLLACYLSYITIVKSDPRDAWLRNFAIATASFIGTSFYSAIVTDADFTAATLKHSDLRAKSLIRTRFKEVKNLDLARVGKTLLSQPNVRELLINPNIGYNKNYFQANLRGANLDDANLKEADLTQADLSEATLKNADLRDSNLTEVNATNTNFTHVYLTGACLESWNIDATTILDNIDCQYVYLLNNKKERKPDSGEFKQGEFTKLFEEVFDIVDLIFRNGIDWKAFIETMKTVQVENEDTPLEVSSIENKGDGFFVVKVKVPPDANKEKIHHDFNEIYQLKLEAVEAKYKAQLEAKETEITIYRQQSIDMMEIVKTQASRPINVEAKAMYNTPNNSKNTTIRNINNSGVLNLGEIIRDVNNTINQISESNNKENEQLKTLLQELMQAIETENELDEDEKAAAANNVETIAKASQNPEDQGLQKKATRAVKLLETLAKGLEPATKLYTACHSILPQIVTFLGITL